MSPKKSKARDLESLLLEYERQITDDTVLAHSRLAECTEGYFDVLDFLAIKGSRRQNYRHYATRKRIDSILSNKEIYLTDGSGWNDKYDRERFNPKFSPFKRFGICMSATGSESIAMWMLYGGTDGNGAMINFDKKTLKNAMNLKQYECGHFDKDGQFICVELLDAKRITFQLVDILYFSRKEDGTESFKVGRAGDRYVELSSYRTLDGLQQIIKHKSWSYESEVRLVASVDKLWLAGRDSSIKCIKVPLAIDEDFISTRVFDSPVSDDSGHYLDSELRGTVDWELCKECEYKQ